MRFIAIYYLTFCDYLLQTKNKIKKKKKYFFKNTILLT